MPTISTSPARDRTTVHHTFQERKRSCGDLQLEHPDAFGDVTPREVDKQTNSDNPLVHESDEFCAVAPGKVLGSCSPGASFEEQTYISRHRNRFGKPGDTSVTSVATAALAQNLRDGPD